MIRLSAAVLDVWYADSGRKPLVQERLSADGAQVGGGSPEKFAAFIKADIAKWAKVVKTAGLAK